MNLFTRTLAIGAVLLTAGLAQAETATQKLATLLSGYDTFSARFEQFTSNNNGRRAQESSGELQLAKPNRFYWNTQKPFPQTIVGDGNHIWVYDPDLEQVTRKPGDTSNNAPAMLLNGQISELEQDYRISNPATTGNEQLFDLAPKQENSSFARIRLFFVNHQLTELMLEDHLGQRTTVLLSEQKINPALAADHFSFIPPDGVDVILEDEL